ncbi:golgin candidate 6-like isoform X3 [Cornus florida]|uniref:golgin candidate 6-like isoform X3 n=1 Tax=Cornus florida TaxID=4283 RepID=UPI0028A19B85|nr:golgin candidate 6-like isoform X3 [Cornus florida]
MNTDLLSREAESISLLLSLLSEEDFNVRYYTLQLLTALLTNSPNRLQEAILTIPRGITRLMDMLMDREVIRNEALLLLTYLTREAEEIQKIVVFEGTFDKILGIVNEEGGSEGGVVVQDCLELLNNLLCNNASNQVLGFLLFSLLLCSSFCC